MLLFFSVIQWRGKNAYKFVKCKCAFLSKRKLLYIVTKIEGDIQAPTVEGVINDVCDDDLALSVNFYYFLFSLLKIYYEI